MNTASLIGTVIFTYLLVGLMAWFYGILVGYPLWIYLCGACFVTAMIFFGILFIWDIFRERWRYPKN